MGGSPTVLSNDKFSSSISKLLSVYIEEKHF